MATGSNVLGGSGNRHTILLSAGSVSIFGPGTFQESVVASILRSAIPFYTHYLMLCVIVLTARFFPHSAVSSPNSPKSPQSTSTAHSQSASVVSEFSSIKKPSNLTLQNRHISSDDSDQNSPMSYPCVYDSGKESSDMSNQSAASHLISFDSPGHSKTELPMAMFDPLYQSLTDETLQQMKQTTSYDSLLQDPNGGTTSGNVSPCIFSTSPNLKRHPSPRGRHTSPRSSLVAQEPLTAASAASAVAAEIKNSPIARPRPRPGQLNSYTSDTRPYSPSNYTRPHRRSNVSPSGSVQSLYAAMTDFDYGAGGGFQSDSDATSTHSSLLDLPHGDDITDPPLVPTPADLGLYFEFDPSKF
jgi:hypothetical protein